MEVNNVDDMVADVVVVRFSPTAMNVTSRSKWVGEPD